MKTAYFVLLFVISRAVETKSVKKGDLVTMNADVTKGPNDTVLWYFNNTRIALINGEASKSCVYDGQGRIFRGRLKVDYDTGSLNITNIRTDHAGLYEAELFRRDNSGTSVPLNRPRSRKCDNTSITLKNNSEHTIKTINITVSDPDDTNDESYKVEEKQDSGKISESTTAGPTRDSTTTASIGENESEKESEGSGLSSGAIAGIVVGAVVVVVVLLVAAAVGGVMIYRRRCSRNDEVKEKNKDDVLLNDEERAQEL